MKGGEKPTENKTAHYRRQKTENNEILYKDTDSETHTVDENIFSSDWSTHV